MAVWREGCIACGMTIATHTPIADIVLNHPETAKVFQARRLDFCCGGSVSLDEACRARDLDVQEVAAELDAAIAHRAGRRGEDLRSLDTRALVALIIERHHGYLRRALPTLEQLSAKVARVHGQKEPRLVAIANGVMLLKRALERHLDEEERELFPRLVAGERSDQVEEALIDAWHEHVDVGRMLAELRSLSDDFQPPPWGCTSYRALFGELEVLEMDLLRHIHLENHVLAPRFHHLASPA